ncbi:hypothetical protein A3709_08265 [Halioglobus sp. HI00S01]|uniref:PilZ domain-containing protein n=1 Tax=Halioglobus sp. HI00S01 TaxID=1822214 RepID=UPI0007C3C2B8|nr:PilZ domain-containing protein [Halioglobus sp. HI00S01]KZX54988.1 hypothetical protein A3709_08265 [Halioglobus sp. HI00S01]
MKPRQDSLLGQASQDELTACIRLLALNVVQQRSNGEFTSFRDSAEMLRPGSADPNKLELIVGSRNVVEEALELVRTLAAEPQPEQADEVAAKPEERRRHMRIAVSAPIKLLWPGDETPTAARLQDISWGGAAIKVDKVKMVSSDTLKVIIPGIHGTPITIDAKYLRSWKLDEGAGEGLAVRFTSMATRDQDELEAVLLRLAQSGDSDGQREHARLHQRLDLQFEGDELKASLEDISAGGLGVTVPEPLEIGQSLQAVISTFDDKHSLKLRARVVRQETISMGKTELYHAGLKFEHPPEELAELTSALISQIGGNR